MELLFHNNDFKALKAVARKVNLFLNKECKRATSSWYKPTVTIMVSKTGKFKLNFSGNKGLGSLVLVKVSRDSKTQEYIFDDQSKPFFNQGLHDFLLEALQETSYVTE